MLEVIEKLLVLQEQDRKILRVKDQLARVGPERQQLLGKSNSSQSSLDSAKTNAKQIESDRKRLELDVDAIKGKIEKYSIQQFQTKKNDEYRALGNEIDNCRKSISQLEDEQLVLMEKLDQANKELAEVTQQFNHIKKEVEALVVNLDAREKTLQKELVELEAVRPGLADTVDETTRAKYERLLKNKGENVVVGVQHGVCGGCHMKLPTQVFLSVRGNQELVTCPNCGRILYFSSEMDLAVAD